MRIAVIVPRSISPAMTIPRIHMPLGALAIASQLQSDGFDVSFIDASIANVEQAAAADYFLNNYVAISFDGVDFWRTGLSDRALMNRIKNTEPDAVAVSCSTVVDREDTKCIIEMIHRELPNVPIILGGHEAYHNYESILTGRNQRDRIKGVFCVCIGLGQPYISEIIRYAIEVKGKSDIELPFGMAIVKEDRLIVTGQKNFDINDYSLFDYSFLSTVHVRNREKPIDVYSYLGNTHAGNIGYLFGAENSIISYYPAFTSYGCGFDCTFCDTDPYLLRYSPQNVIKMIENFDSLFGIDYIDFMDNNFAGGNKVSRDTCFEILEYIFHHNYKIGFSNGLTFESMYRNNFELLRLFNSHDNVLHIAFPCENGNDRVLKMVRKPHTLLMMSRVLETAKKLLPSTNKEGFFIGGFPETEGEFAETPEEIDQTLLFIENLLSEDLLQQAIFLKLSPVTSVYRNVWEQKYPDKSFVHCLFSKGTGICPYDANLLEVARTRVEEMNKTYARKVTRKL